MAGSVNMKGRDIEFRIKAGDRKTLTVTVKDQCGCTVPLCCTTLFDSTTFRVWRPDGTLLISDSGTYSCRAAGQVSYILKANDATVCDVGNWEGEFELFNDSCPAVLSDQTETFNFVILHSY